MSKTKESPANMPISFVKFIVKLEHTIQTESVTLEYLISFILEHTEHKGP